MKSIHSSVQKEHRLRRSKIRGMYRHSTNYKNLSNLPSTMKSDFLGWCLVELTRMPECSITTQTYQARSVTLIVHYTGPQVHHDPHIRSAAHHEEATSTGPHASRCDTDIAGTRDAERNGICRISDPCAAAQSCV